MQKYTPIGDTSKETVKQALLNHEDNINSIRSSNSGSSFPTENLVAGMKCYRTDLKAEYTYDGKDWLKITADKDVSESVTTKSLTVSGETSVPTPSTENNSQTIANTEFVHGVVNKLVNGAPSALDTLQELSAALGDDPNFSTTVLNKIGEKESKEDANIEHTALKNAMVTGVEEVAGGALKVSKGDGTTKTVNAGLNMLARNKSYAVGDIAYSPNLPSYLYLECIMAGTTGNTEPDFSNVKSGGVTVSDGTVQFDVKTVIAKEYVDSKSAEEAQKWKKAYNDLRKRSYPTEFDDDELTVLNNDTYHGSTNLTLLQPYTAFDGLYIILTDNHKHIMHSKYISTWELNRHISRQITLRGAEATVALGTGIAQWNVWVHSKKGFNTTLFPYCSGSGYITGIYGVKFKEDT